MLNNFFSMSDEQREQKEAFKKTLRIYSDGIIDYNIRFDVIDYDFSKDEEFKKILDSFENSYNLESIESLKKEISITGIFEKRKYVFMYDGKNKFTQDRKKTLEQYPEDFKIGFCLSKWIKYCEEIEYDSTVSLQNALMDMMIDFAFTKSGYTVIRVKQDAFDWTDKGALRYLEEMIEQAKRGEFCEI